MKNIRFYIIASSLVLCLWLTAAFSVQSEIASPLAVTPAKPGQTNPPSAEPVKQKQSKIKNAVADDKDPEAAEISEPVALIE